MICRRTERYRYGFTGKEKDRETNLDYFGARNYDEDICRWTCVDPLSEKYMDLNPYNYVSNNPIFYLDPNGKEIVDAQGKVAVTLDKNGKVKFTEYATSDIKRVVNAMIVTNTGNELVHDMIAAKHSILINIRNETLYKNPQTGALSKVQKEGFTNIVGAQTISNPDGLGGLKSARIEIYEGSINLLVKTLKQSGYTKEEHIGIMGVHEATHATDKNSNVRLSKPGTNLEKKPKENELRHKLELKKGVLD